MLTLRQVVTTITLDVNYSIEKNAIATDLGFITIILLYLSFLVILAILESMNA